MKNFKNNNEILFIPGWLDVGERNGYKNSLDIWNKSIDIKQDLKAKCVIAHSLGTLAALYNWNLYKNFRIILVNPVTSKKNIFKRWYKFNESEGLPDSFKKTVEIKNIGPSLVKMNKLFEVPALDIINTIPKNDLFVIYGENDTHLFDLGAVEELKEKGFKVKRIKGAGHNYGIKIDKAVSNLLNTLL